MPKLTEVEKILRDAERERDRLKKKDLKTLNALMKKPRAPRMPRAQPSEAQLVHKYVNQVIGGKVARGHVDTRFGYTKKDGTVSKECWLDADFFFTVVFESEAQKNLFLEFFQNMFKFELEDFDDNQIQIINGIKLAKSMGLELKRETSREYPQPALDLLPFVLDNESY
jgi:hypothetical protein